VPVSDQGEPQHANKQLFNHAVGGDKEGLWHRDIEHLGGVGVYDQLEFCRQLYREISRFRSLQQLVHKSSRAIKKCRVARVELLKQMVPSLSRVALLVNPSDPQVARRTFDESRAAADRPNMTLEQVEARAPGDLEQTFSIIVEKKFDGIVIANDPMLFNERQRIGEWRYRTKTPL
jgi:hypothetical protein